LRFCLRYGRANVDSPAVGGLVVLLLV